ncbi:MAG: hypothetical protein CSA75_01625 [Sorangium cellulosum]|nr:MAG: hypothetical protein CSA75_01625 [Sorangium cellulosum]
MKLVKWMMLTASIVSTGCASGPKRARHIPQSGYCSPKFQAQFGWPEPEKAAQVCHCESSGNPQALSPNGKYAGLFQFSETTWLELGGGPVFDPTHNSRRAVQLFRKRGWKPWPSCSK